MYSDIIISSKINIIIIQSVGLPFAIKFTYNIMRILQMNKICSKFKIVPISAVIAG